MVSTAQLRAAGLAKDGIVRRVAKGLLHPRHRAVYAVGHMPLTRRSDEWAAVLACGDGAVLSHMTAGALWGIVKPGREIHVTTPRTRKGPDGVTTHRTRRLDPADHGKMDGLPVTSLHRTLVDLADTLTQPNLAKAIHEAEIKRAFDLRLFDQALARVPGRKGRHRLRRACEDYRPPPVTRSEAEILFQAFLEETGIRAPECNATRAGYELDCWWPDASLNVEVDGAATHHTTQSFHADRRRDRALKREGIEVIRITWKDLTTGRAELERDLKEILARR